MLTGIERKSGPGPARMFCPVCHMHVPAAAAAQMVLAGIEIHQHKMSVPVTRSAVPRVFCRIDPREYQIDALQSLSGGADHAALDTAHLLLAGVFWNAYRRLGLWRGGWLRRGCRLLARGRNAEQQSADPTLAQHEISLLISGALVIGRVFRRNQFELGIVPALFFNAERLALILVRFQEFGIFRGAGVDVFPSEKLVVPWSDTFDTEMAVLVGSAVLVELPLVAVGGRYQHDGGARGGLLFRIRYSALDLTAIGTQ